MRKSKFDTEKIIYCDLDSVLGSLITGTLLKPKYGQVDVIHGIRQEIDPDEKLSDAEILAKCKRDVISTCWNMERTAKAVRAMGKTTDQYRIYTIGHRLGSQ